MVNDGGAVVETRDVEYCEGRHASPYNNTLHEELPCLDLIRGFTEVDAPAPDAMVMAPGRIVIDGMTEHDRIEIRGKGDFGYDENGRIVGDFNDLPMILIDEYEPPFPDDRDERTFEVWTKKLGAVEPNAPAQFDRATRGRPLGPDNDGGD
jgi:hypothetical protein